MAMLSVDRCLKMCGLETYQDAIVGSLGVEMKKRTTIGVELAAKVRTPLEVLTLPNGSPKAQVTLVFG